MDSLPYLIGLIGYQALRVLNPREGYCLIYLVGGLAFALGVMLWRRRGRKSLRARGFLRLLGSKRLWTHRSNLLDLRLYLMHGVLIIVGYSLLEGSSEMWRTGAGHTLTAVFGHSPALAAPRWLVGGATTLLQVLALEFGYWALHYAFHKVPAMWELHKVHHSAEVMTPLTEWRQHPIEFIAFANVLTLSMGVVFGAMSWLFGKSAEPFTLFQLNAVLVLHLLTFHHLRHSGRVDRGAGWLGRLVHSPAHHQLHHSTDPGALRLQSRLFAFGVRLGVRHAGGSCAAGAGEARGRRRGALRGRDRHSGQAVHRSREAVRRPRGSASPTLGIESAGVVQSQG